MNLSITTNISASELFYLHLESVTYEYSEIEVNESLADWIDAFCGYKSAFKIHLMAARYEFAGNKWALLLIDQYLKEINK